jgi:rubrerythrin
MAADRIVVVDGEADSAQIAAFERGRREILRRGLGLGGAMIAASSIPLLLSVRDAFATTSSDGDLLIGAIKLEQVAVLAYGKLIDAVPPSGFDDVLRRFQGHEQLHASTLTKALTDLGGTPPPKSTEQDVDAVVKGIEGVRSHADAASFAIELEMAAVAAYYDAQSKFIDAKLLQTGVAIMANEGQHLVVLRQFVKQPPLPNPFEIGTPK